VISEAWSTCQQGNYKLCFEVAHIAQPQDAPQACKGKLSELENLPKLDIDADDVACSHLPMVELCEALIQNITPALKRCA
jgi:hypothetical protein